MNQINFKFKSILKKKKGYIITPTLMLCQRLKAHSDRQWIADTGDWKRECKHVLHKILEKLMSTKICSHGISNLVRKIGKAAHVNHFLTFRVALGCNQGPLPLGGTMFLVCLRTRVWDNLGKHVEMDQVHLT